MPTVSGTYAGAVRDTERRSDAFPHSSEVAGTSSEALATLPEVPLGVCGAIGSRTRPPRTDIRRSYHRPGPFGEVQHFRGQCSALIVWWPRQAADNERVCGCGLYGDMHAIEGALGRDGFTAGAKGFGIIVRQQSVAPSPPPCDIPSGRCFFTGRWTVTRSSPRVLRRVAVF